MTAPKLGEGAIIFSQDVLGSAPLILPYRLPAEFSDIEMPLAKQIIASGLWEGTEVNRRFMTGDHWQDMDGVPTGWVGPIPRKGVVGYTEAYQLILGGFVSRNVVKEVVERHTNGLLGRAPEWGFTLRRKLKQDESVKPAEQALIDEAEAFLSTWWDNRKGYTFLKQLTSNVLWAARSSIRLLVPPGKLVDVNITASDGSLRRGKAVAVKGLEQALDLIWIEAPNPENSTVFYRQSDREAVGIVVGRRQDTGLENMELTYLEKDLGTNRRKTVFQLVDQSEENKVVVKLDLGGRLPVFEICRDPLVTKQVQQEQRALNLSLSIIPRSVVTSGFLERIFLNAQLPGEWKEDSVTKEKRFFPDKYSTGAGTTNFMVGVEHENAESGATELKDPEVIFREPTDPSFAIKAVRAQYQNILEEVDQQHILMSSDAMASGLAREMARQEFSLSITKTQEVVEQAGRWMLETVLALAEAFSGTPGKYTKELKSYFHCKVDTGPVSSDERAQYGNEVGDGRMSSETAMHLSGIDDVDAEKARINGEPHAKIGLAEKRGTAVKALVDGGYTIEDALAEVGHTPEEVKRLAANAKKKQEEDRKVQMDQIKLTAKAKGEASAKPVVKKPKPKTA